MPVKEIRQCSSCGGFCKKSGCERENVPPETTQKPLRGCVCQWNAEGDRVVTCERHQGWLEVIAEWADRAREAEAKLKKTTSPQPQKPWVGLTDDDMEKVFPAIATYHEANKTLYRSIACAIEAALKEKNT